MPLYEYECPGCGRDFEKLTRMSESDKVQCPHCANKHPQRKLSRIAIKGQSVGGGGSEIQSAPVSL